MLLPEPRGPITQRLRALRVPGSPVDVAALSGAIESIQAPLCEDDDAQLALWILYELHYRGFDDIDPRAEWSPDLIAVRGRLESRFEAELRSLTREPVQAALAAAGSIADRIFAMVRNDQGPRLASFVQREIDPEQFRELLIHRSVYHLKEADPHSFAIPRLSGRAKAALIEIQFDEYGSGRAADMHSALFARTMRRCGLLDTYGAYLDDVPGYVLAGSNAMSMFGLQRRLRGATCGHLAAFEATSSLPNRKYAAGVRRLGYGDDAARYFDEHVAADAVHEQVAVREMCAALVADEPDCEEDVLFGVATCLALDGLSVGRLLLAWRAGRTTLRSESAPRRPRAADAFRWAPIVLAAPSRPAMSEKAPG